MKIVHFSSGSHLVFLIICLVWCCAVPEYLDSSSSEQTCFYHNYGYGSDAQFNPLSTILNGGFFVTMSSNISNRLNYLDYQVSAHNLFYNLTHPLENIQSIGWKNFISSELFPLSLKPTSAQYIPNWTLHFIGCGSDFQAILEWYQTKGFSNPRAWTFLTYLSGRFLNELVENGNYSGRSVDAIADMYFFDPLGILFFELESVSRFFSTKLNLANWSYQPMISFNEGRIENVGDHYSMKYFPFDKIPLGIIACAGINSSIGLSWRSNNQNCFSVGGGFSVNNIVTVNDQDSTRIQTATTTWNASFYYDRNNSLMMSLILSGNRRYFCQANLYPGLISWNIVKPGFFFALTNTWKPLVGINFSWNPLWIAF